MTHKITLSIVSALLLISFSMADEATDLQAKTQEASTAAIEVTDVESAYASNSSVSNASKELKQSINFGYAGTTGNSESTSFNAKYLATFTTTGYDNEELRVGFDLSGYMNKIEGAQKVEEYMANLGIEQNIYDGWFGYAALNWYKNEALGFNNKTSIGAGIGKMLFSDTVHSLKVKLGAAYNLADFANVSDVNADDSYTTLNQYIEYNRILNSNSNFYAKLGASESIDDFSDIEGIAVLGLNFAVADKISVSIEEEIKYNGLGVFSDVLDSKADTKTVIRIGYNF